MNFCYTFEKKVKNYIEEHHMAEKGEHLIVGVSGGADSICLLELLYRFAVTMEWNITVVHVHHGIRGIDADKDERFVIEFCEKRGLHWKSFHYQIPLEAKMAKEGEEEAGRRLRYQALEETLKMHQADKIVLAHHKEDQAETVLFHFLRGSSLKGLCGMQPKNGNRIRPLLCVDKKEICRYLKEQGISYQVDQSNFSEKYTRNYLRLQVLPLLERVNQGVIENINRTSRQFLEAEEYLTEQTRAAAIRLNLCAGNGDWKESPLYLEKESYEREAFFIRKRVLYDILCSMAESKRNFEERHILSVDALFFKPVGKRIELPYKLWAKREYLGVFIGKEQEDFPKKTDILKEWSETLLFSKEEREKNFTIIEKNFHLLPLSGYKELSAQGKIFKWKIFLPEKNKRIPKNNYTKWFDYDKISSAALFRTRRAGDWFVMDSSGRHKKLTRYFIHEKISKEQREKQLLLADKNHIIWIIGKRISEAYKVQETTRVILELQLVGKEEHN